MAPAVLPALVMELAVEFALDMGALMGTKAFAEGFILNSFALGFSFEVVGRDCAGVTGVDCAACSTGTSQSLSSQEHGRGPRRMSSLEHLMWRNQSLLVLHHLCGLCTL